MSDFNGLRRVLNKKAVLAANTAGITIQLPNEELALPKGQVYTGFWHKSGGSRQAECGANTGLEMTVGIFQFDIMSPENQGDGPALAAADLIRPVFNRKEWLVEPNGYVKILVANVKTPFSGPIDGHYRVIVDGTYHYYYSNPNAPDFRD